VRAPAVGVCGIGITVRYYTNILIVSILKQEKQINVHYRERVSLFLFYCFYSLRRFKEKWLWNLKKKKKTCVYCVYYTDYNFSSTRFIVLYYIIDKKKKIQVNIKHNTFIYRSLMYYRCAVEFYLLLLLLGTYRRCLDIDALYIHCCLKV